MRRTLSFDRALGIVGTLLGIFGVWAYFASVKEPSITYAVDPVRTTVVQSGAPTGLSVSFNGEPITGGVTSVTLGVWNDGRAPIRASDVLEKVTLSLPQGTRILSVNVIRQSRRIVNFGASLVSPSPKPGFPPYVEMTFDILEHNDSAIAQVIYEGDPNADAVITGSFVGQPAIRKMTVHPRTPAPQSRSSRIFLTLLSIVAGLMVIVSAALALRNAIKSGKGLLRLGVIGPVGSILFVAGAVCYIVWDVLIRIPPFSFGD